MHSRVSPNSVLKDSKRASEDNPAQKTISPPGNVLADLVSHVMGAEDAWSHLELKEKVESFRQGYPRLYRLFEKNLTELHKFASR